MSLRLLPQPGIDRCTLSWWGGEPGHCHWCDGACEQGSDWCSVACSDAYESNHNWAEARSAVLARDREVCACCGSGPGSAREFRLLLRALVPMSPVDAARLWHSQEWLALELACSVEVVHLDTPHESYRSGCHHHLDELVTHCRRCQERARLAPVVLVG